MLKLKIFNKHVYRFYLLLVVLYFADMILLLSNIWNSLKVTSSPIFLGITLSIGTIFPYILSKIKKSGLKTSLSMNNLYKRRIIIYSTLLLLAIWNYADTRLGFIVTSLSLGYISMLTLSTLESNNTKLVLDGYISSDLASRIMQTLVQIGSFFGALCSGYFLITFDYNDLILFLCLFDISISLVGILIFHKNKNKSNIEVDTRKIKTSYPKKIILSSELKYLSFSLGLIGLQICAFNSLIPIVFQNIHKLGSEYYGICSGAAGLGAFLSVFLKLNKFQFILPAFLLFLTDLFIMQTDNIIFLVICCFFMGLSMNTIRINLRKNIIDGVHNKQESEEVAKFSSLIYTLAQSLGALLLGLLTSNAVFGFHSAIYLMPVVGLICLCSLIKIRSNK